MARYIEPGEWPQVGDGRERHDSHPPLTPPSRVARFAAMSMRGGAQVDRTLVAILDIDKYSSKPVQEQARLVRHFLDDLNNRLQGLSGLSPDAFSTGDGAIISIGRECAVDAAATGLFLDFVIDLMGSLIEHGLSVKGVAHYSEHDWLVEIDQSSPVAGQYVQVGDTINHATRMLGFCDPRELVISAGLFVLLERLNIAHRYSFRANPEYVAKHQERLRTHTYVSPTGVFYSPEGPEHLYKRYTAFPPVARETLDEFDDPGLRTELTDVISNTYESLRAVNSTKAFLSWSSVIDVLREVEYDPADTVYVLSRNDTASGFWTQPRRLQYIDHLRAHATRHGGKINQVRIMVYDDLADPDVVAPDDIMFDLHELHPHGTFKRFPASMLRVGYRRLFDLRFGGTFSDQHGFGIVSIPPPEAVEADQFAPDKLGPLLGSFANYDVASGPMKALISADRSYVRAVVDDMKRLLQDPQAADIKVGPRPVAERRPDS